MQVCLGEVSETLDTAVTCSKAQHSNNENFGRFGRGNSLDIDVEIFKNSACLYAFTVSRLAAAQLNRSFGFNTMSRYKVDGLSNP